jgi:hypothetical protein
MSEENESRILTDVERGDGKKKKKKVIFVFFHFLVNGKKNNIFLSLILK